MAKITIGIVTFNRIDLLKRAVKSVLSQSYKNYIIFIGNDNPKNKINLKMLGLKSNKKIKIFNHKKNIGERNNLNYLLKKCKTDLFCWLGDDDYLHKDFFKILEKQFKKKKNLIASYSNYSRVELKSKSEPSRALHYNKISFLEGFTSKKIRMIGTFGLMKTKFLKKIGGIHKTGKSFKRKNKITHHYPYCDPLVAILLSNYGKISWINKRLVYLNTDSTSTTASTNEYDTYVSAEKYLTINLKKSLIGINSDRISKRILFNIYEWFLFNRLTVIKKGNPIKNIFRILKYISDFYIFFKNDRKFKVIHVFLFNILRLFKSILISFKNI